MKTRQDLIAATLKLLNVLAAGQTPEAEDATEVDQKIDGMMAQLSRRNVVSIYADDGIPDEFLDPVATIIANEVAPLFGQARNEQSRYAAEMLLREMTSPDFIKADVIRAEYF